MIAERIVLLRIENFKQSRRRITAIIVAEFVNFVEHHHRIIDTGTAQRLDDSARHRADISAPMST